MLCMTRCRSELAWTLLGIAAVAILVALNSPPLLVGFFLHRLRCDPRLLREYAALPPSNLHRTAATFFVSELEGQEALVRWYLEEALITEAQAEKVSAQGTGPPAGREWLQCADRVLLLASAGDAASRPPIGFVAESQAGSISAWRSSGGAGLPDELLERIAWIDLQLPEYPRLLFRVLPALKAKDFYCNNARSFAAASPELLRPVAEGYACLACSPEEFRLRPPSLLLPRWMQALVPR